MARKILTAAQVLAANDLRTEFVSCPEWAPEFAADGVTPTTQEERAEFGLIMRSLTGLERGRFVQRTVANKAAAEKGAAVEDMDATLETQLLITCAVDEEGNNVFTDEAAQALAASDPEHYGDMKTAADMVQHLRNKNANPIGRCSQTAQRMSGLTPEVQKSVVKTSETIQSGASSSG